MHWIYCFQGFVLDEFGGELRHGRRLIEIQSKPFNLLCYFVRNNDRFIRAAEILEAVWPGLWVSEYAFSSALRDLRRALKDSDRHNPILLTVRGRGYRLMPTVTKRPRGAEPTLAEGATANFVSKTSEPALTTDQIDVLRAWIATRVLNG